MIADHTVADALHAWKEHAQASGPHLDAAILYDMTAPNGLVHSDPVALSHLSLCPVCLGAWADWRRARSAAESDSLDDDLLISCGFLLAAATAELTEGMSLQSQCGSYRLDILPQAGEPDRGLATFEVLVPGLMLEGATVSIRDRNGRVLLRGHISDGRLARPLDRLADFDLSTWTVTIGRAASDN